MLYMHVGHFKVSMHLIKKRKTQTVLDTNNSEIGNLVIQNQPKSAMLLVFTHVCVGYCVCVCVWPIVS